MAATTAAPIDKAQSELLSRLRQCSPGAGLGFYELKRDNVLLAKGILSLFSGKKQTLDDKGRLWVRAAPDVVFKAYPEGMAKFKSASDFMQWSQGAPFEVAIDWAKSAETRTLALAPVQRLETGSSFVFAANNGVQSWLKFVN